MRGSSRELFGLSFWMDNSKIDRFKDILNGKKEIPKHRADIIKSLSDPVLPVGQ
ncbi:MAG: hypothetical protein AAGK47_09865 [Bacteroidota bacterium]